MSGHAAAGNAPRDRTAERGAILLVVLILCVTLCLLSMALISTSEVSMRAADNGNQLEQAERAAHSGVEWAAAMVKTSGLVDATRTLVFDGLETRVTIRASQSPTVLAQGRSHGVAVTVGADLVTGTGAPLPHAYASFNGTNRFDEGMIVDGMAYLGEPFGPIASGAKPLQMFGDLHLVTSTAVPNGAVTHLKGSSIYAVAPVQTPRWDTDYLEAGGGHTVPVRTYSGTTEIRDQTLDGLIVVKLGLGQHLKIRDSVIRGTIVVPTPFLATLPIVLLPPEIRIRGNSTIQGGTAETGNLAILAPDCDLTEDNGVSSLVSGVTYVRTCKVLGTTTFRGQLLVRGSTTSTAGAYRVERPLNFMPDVPVGITWPGVATVRIDWRGRQ